MTKEFRDIVQSNSSNYQFSLPFLFCFVTKQTHFTCQFVRKTTLIALDAHNFEHCNIDIETILAVVVRTSMLCRKKLWFNVLHVYTHKYFMVSLERQFDASSCCNLRSSMLYSQPITYRCTISQSQWNHGNSCMHTSQMCWSKKHCHGNCVAAQSIHQHLKWRKKMNKFNNKKKPHLSSFLRLPIHRVHNSCNVEIVS